MEAQINEGDVFIYPLYDMQFYVYKKMEDDLYHCKIVRPFKIKSNVPVFLEVYVSEKTILENKK